MLIHVIHHHVDPMLNVQTVNADALLNIKEIHTKVVDQSVQQMLIVAEIVHVCEANVLIHVLEHVGKMLNVKLLIIFQSVHVRTVILAIHFLIVVWLKLYPSQNVIHVIHHLAVQIHNVETLTIMQYVRVYKDLLVHRLNVDLNVLSAVNVHKLRPVSTINVLIHVVEHVVLMHVVKYLTTVQFAVVAQDKLVIRSKVVRQYLKNQLIIK